MTILSEQLLETLTKYENLRDIYKVELEHCPDGSLLHQMDNNKPQFLRSVNINGKRVRRGINRNPGLIKALAKKEFDTKAYEILSNNTVAIREAIEKLVPFDPDRILDSMTNAYKLLPDEYFFDRDKLIINAGIDNDLLAKIKKHEEWWKKPYKEYWGYPENKTRTTSRGQKVRSISELRIAEALYKYSIPFHYEEELKVEGKTFAPDFTFEGWDYNNFYLDYFGMMDDEKYAKKNFLKLDDYYDIGLIPGDNLITVFDSKGIMNAGVIESIIQNEIIPRL
jgi:hypothetical protein